MKCIYFLLTLLLLIPFYSFSQSNEDAIRITDNQLGFGARALGMGGAYSGVADDYSAVYWNPAGLAQMRKMEFWLELSHVNFNNDLVYLNQDLNASTSATKFGSFGMVFPVPTYRGSLVFSLGYQRLKDFEYANEFTGMSAAGSDRLDFFLDSTDTVYPFYGEPAQKNEFSQDEGSLNQWSAAGAVDISPNISAGLALNYWTGSSDYQLDFSQVDVNDNFDSTMYPANFYDYLENRRIQSSYSSFSMKLGGLFRAGRFARIGLGIQLPQTFTVKEDYLLESSVSFDDGEIIYFADEQGEFEYKVKMPFRFNAGASVAAGGFLLAAGAEYTDWTQVKFDKPSGADLNQDYASLLNQNRFFKSDYRGTLKWQVGGEAGLPFLDSQVRAGFIYDPSPSATAQSENDRKYITLGYGVLIDRIFKIDVAYLRGTWQQETFDDLAPSGTAEDITYQKFVFTFAYRF
ncbi:MAG: hypothetical protein WAN36_09255 [Calditrichia bacterium]